MWHALQVVQPDVVLASFDALASDISHLQPIEWEAIVVDERCMVQSNLVKAHQALREVESNFRLLLPAGNPTMVHAAHACHLHSSPLPRNNHLFVVQLSTLGTPWHLQLHFVWSCRLLMLLHAATPHTACYCKLLCGVHKLNAGV